MLWLKTKLSRSARSRISPSARITSTPASLSRSSPRPAWLGLGSGWPRGRVIPESRIARVQGGVRPSVEQGSRENVKFGSGLRRPTEGPEGLDLGMRVTGYRMVAFPDHLAVLHDQGSHHGVGVGPAPPFLGQLDRPKKEGVLGSGIHGDRKNRETLRRGSG